MANRICYRWGPGRLPLADRRGIGGGFAIAGMGLAVTILWFAVVFGANTVGLRTEFTEFLLFWAPRVLPVAGLGTFVAAVVMWRLSPPDEHPLMGALYGIVSGGVGLLVGPVGAALYVYYTIGAPLTVSGMGYAVVAYQGVAMGTVIAVAWLVLPALAFAGWYHERQRRPS